MNKSENLTDLSDDEIMNIDDTQLDYSESEEKELDSNQEIDVDQDNQENESDTDQELENTEEQQQQQQELTPEFYKEFYQKVMAPFKADGTMITPENENDIISLMQKGANYTKKMQAISSQRRAIDVLQREGLLDPNQLSYMIDLKHGNPDAIKKLLKDNQGKFDVYDADLDDVQYTPTELPEVNEQENAVQEVMNELYATPEGKSVIDESLNWDKVSHEWLYKNPSILKTLSEQCKSGIYQKILQEIGNMDALGRFNPNTPFLEKYTQAGNKLAQMGVITIARNTQQQQQQQQIITRGPAQNSNHNRARSAGIMRNTHGNSNMVPNPAAMSDEDFLKAFAQRI